MRKLFILAMCCALLAVSPSSFSASPKVGGSCLKVNQFQEVGSALLVCATAKGKKTWRKATPVEKSLYLKEKSRLAAADKAAADKAAADKAAADKAAADSEANAVAKVAAPIFEGLPSEMVVGNTYSVTIRGIAQESCSTIITSANSQELKFSLSVKGTAILSVKPSGNAGTLEITASCQKSGTSTVRIPVVSKVTVAPKASAVPSPSTSGSVRRYSKVCIDDIPAINFKASCQDSYPYWSISLCSPRLNGLAWSIYLDDYAGTKFSSFSKGQRMKSEGIDSPGRCPDPSRPLYFQVGDFIPTQVVAPSNFRALYRLVYAYISNGTLQRFEYQFTVAPG